MQGGKTLSWTNGGAVIRWLTEVEIAACERDVRGWLLDPDVVLPIAWAGAQAIFLPKPSTTDIDTHRPVVPSAPFIAWASRAVLLGHTEAMQLAWVAVEGFVQGEERAPTF